MDVDINWSSEEGLLNNVPAVNLLHKSFMELPFKKAGFYELCFNLHQNQANL